jgi:iron complex transport system permease protein
MNMKVSGKFTIGALCALAILCLGASLGSSSINVLDTIRIILNKIAALPLGEKIEAKNVAIVWNLRLPRAILAFIIGGALSMSGAVFQSILKNQLASPYILGVSAGASLGAGIVILTGFVLPFIGGLTLPAAGFIFSLITIFIVIAFSSRIDKTLSNNTIILFGMVFSLFVNAILTTLTALYREELKNLLYWQMGSFSLKGWSYVGLMLPFLILGTFGIFRYIRELDILTFGEEQAKSIGVDTQGIRIKLLICSAVLTGSAVALSGAIGFVDLIAPHAAR